ncbi:MAG: helix-turn-helix domain-containing protein [Verrucomicrobiota bacterium]
MPFETPIRSSQQLGQLIAAARRRKSLSQRDVAQELGVTQAWVSRVERGQQKAWIGQVLRLATWLDLEITGRLPDDSDSVKHRVESGYPDIDKIANS